MSKKKKWYVIKFKQVVYDLPGRIGQPTKYIIVGDWSECELYIKGRACQFKGFSRFEDAEAWINNTIKDGFYTDASYNEVTDDISWAYILVLNGKIEFVAGGLIIDQDLKLMQNVGGELYAFFMAVYKLLELEIDVPIYFDLELIEKLLKGIYKPRKKIIRKWIKDIQGVRNQLPFKLRYTFIHSHSGNEGNIIVDKLAALILGK